MYLSLNKTSPGKLISEICKNFFFSYKLLTTGLELELKLKLELELELELKLELEPEPPS